MQDRDSTDHAQVKHTVQNTSKSNISATAFNRFQVTLGRIASSTIALISGSTPIGLGVPLWKLVVVAGMRWRTGCDVGSSRSTSAITFSLHHKTQAK
jgi:hypothetical protein